MNRFVCMSVCIYVCLFVSHTFLKTLYSTTFYRYTDSAKIYILLSIKSFKLKNAFCVAKLLTSLFLNKLYFSF